MKVTAERLRQVLDYDATTGVFHWKVNASRVARTGDVAGYLGVNGYRDIGVDKHLYRAHVLAWLHTYGEWPREVDHRNGVRDDNRITNLREVTRRQNAQNTNRPRSNNRSGYLGVSRKGDGWRAEIMTDGIRRFLGYFDTPKEAHGAYLAAKRQLHPYWEPPAA